MYDNHHGGSAMKLPCKIDLEAEAKHQFERIQNMREFLQAIEEFRNSSVGHEIDDRQDMRSLFAIYGGLTLNLKQRERNYERTLKQIEEEND